MYDKYQDTISLLLFEYLFFNFVSEEHLYIIQNTSVLRYFLLRLFVSILNEERGVQKWAVYYYILRQIIMNRVGYTHCILSFRI